MAHVNSEKGYTNDAVASGGAAAPVRRRIANPAPLGLLSFASTTLLLSFVNVNARGVVEQNIAVAMALGVGGLAQFLAGMWEFAAGNTFGATAFSSYGGFWFSFAAILIPGTGILESFSAKGASANEASNALAFWLLTWFIFTFIMFVASLRSNVGLVALFFFLDLTFMLLMVGAFTGKVMVNKAAGGLGIVTAAIAYYVGASELMPKHASLFTLPTYGLPKHNQV